MLRLLIGTEAGETTAARAAEGRACASLAAMLYWLVMCKKRAPAPPLRPPNAADLSPVNGAYFLPRAAPTGPELEARSGGGA